MSNSRFCLPKGRIWPPRATRAPLTVETLEDRLVPSITLNETEPNNSPWETNVILRVLDAEIRVKGAVNAPGDHDWFRIDLQQGDVFGAALKGKGNLDPKMDLYNSSGELVMGCDDSFFTGANMLPRNSPLPRHHSSERDPELYTVIAAAGTYYLDVAAFDNETAGKYNLDVVVARPGLESQPAGTRQILFLDFDGAEATFNGERWPIAPLVDSLPDWGLTAADENAVIDAILTRVTDRLSTFVRANGTNGDFASTGIPGQFDLEIRNSRDHADDFGTNPFVSRVAIGASNDSRLANEFIGLAETIDVGNFQTDDQAVVSVNFVPFALSSFPVQAPATSTDMAAEYIAIIAAHEFAHLVGCFHTDVSPTDPFEGVPTFMDISFESPLGPDLTFGTADDRTLQLRADTYSRDEVFTGLNDTLNTVSFGLSTGKGAAAASARIRNHAENRLPSAGIIWHATHDNHELNKRRGSFRK